MATRIRYNEGYKKLAGLFRLAIVLHQIELADPDIAESSVIIVIL